MWVKFRGVVNDVIGVPGSCRYRGHNQRRGLFIKRAHHTIDVGWIVIIVQNLDFITILKVYPAVAFGLTVCGIFRAAAPFDMELYTAKIILGLKEY